MTAGTRAHRGACGSVSERSQPCHNARLMSILLFEDIQKSYGETVALRGVSFEVKAGEVFGLLGPNGAGKTTLMRILMDIIRPDAGRMTIFGEPPRREHL